MDHHKAYYEGVPVGPRGEALRRHGDQLESLPNGYLRVIGRVDDTMNLGGIKVGSAEIERVVAGAPGAQEVAAICVAPPDGGPSQLIVCVGTGPSARMDAEKLQQTMQHAIKTRLNPLFKIHDVFVVDQLPRTASNKIMRRQLRTQYERQRT
jgi:acetyl-CoA synthetase